MQQIGVDHWCMRYEAKHSYFKDLAHCVKCCKNIPKTLTEQFVSGKPLVKKMNTGKIDGIKYSQQSVVVLVADVLPDFFY